MGLPATNTYTHTLFAQPPPQQHPPPHPPQHPPPHLSPQDIRALDDISFADWFKSHGGSEASIKRMWDPIGETDWGTLTEGLTEGLTES